MEDDTLVRYLIIIFSVLMIFQSLLAFLITSNVVMLSSTAVIYPPVEVIYTEFNGSTTNFSALDENGLKIITNLTLEVNQHGRVIFDGVTDLTADKDKYNKIDIDSYAEIRHNYIGTDTNMLGSLRKSATVIIYNLTLENPRILVDGFACPPTICQMLDYTNGTIIFRVNQFSFSYSAEETPEEQAPSPGPSRPGVTLPVSNFTTDKDFIKVSLKQGETFLDYVKVKNTGEAPLTFRISVEGLEDNVAVSEESFVLNKGSGKTLTVAFTAPDEEPADVYTGRLVLEAGGLKRVVLLLMEVKEKKPLFDIYVNLKDVPVEAAPGEQVQGDIMMYNFGDLMPVDVRLYYSLRDFDGKDILYKYDTLAVQEQAHVLRSLRIPSDLEPGFYVFYSSVEYGNQTASSSGLIKVVKRELPLPLEIPVEMLLAAVMTVAVLMILLAYRKVKDRLSGSVRYFRMPRLRFWKRRKLLMKIRTSDEGIKTYDEKVIEKAERMAEKEIKDIRDEVEREFKEEKSMGEKMARKREKDAK